MPVPAPPIREPWGVLVPRTWAEWFRSIMVAANGAVQKEDGYTGSLTVSTPSGDKVLTFENGQFKGVA